MNDSLAHPRLPVPTILVVDDDPAVRQVLVDLLSDEGYRVVQAIDGEEALLVLGTTTVHLLLCDVRMPRLDGPGLVEELRRRGNRVPVVLISAHYHAVDLPGVSFMAKPFALDHLLRTILTPLGP